MAATTVTPLVKEMERTLLFTDVPCGALKFKPDCAEDTTDTKEGEEQDFSKNITVLCGTLERAFCFSDLQDVNDTTKAVESPEKDDPPAVEAADTESMSDDSAGAKDEAAVDVKKVEEATTETPAESTTPAAEAPKKEEEPKKAEPEAVLPPANALQASKNKKNNGKPMNRFQAARAAKKAEKEAKKKDMKKKGWSLFGKSNKKATSV